MLDHFLAPISEIYFRWQHGASIAYLRLGCFASTWLINFNRPHYL
jgi:hypothetical protein